MVSVERAAVEGVVLVDAGRHTEQAAAGIHNAQHTTATMRKRKPKQVQTQTTQTKRSATKQRRVPQRHAQDLQSEGAVAGEVQEAEAEQQ